MKASSMNVDSNETELDRRALAISVWENKGGSRAPDTPHGNVTKPVRDHPGAVHSDAATELTVR